MLKKKKRILGPIIFYVAGFYEESLSTISKQVNTVALFKWVVLRFRNNVFNFKSLAEESRT